MTDNIESSRALELLFNDAAKTISDLKSREWQATTLAIAGIMGIVSYSHGGETHISPAWLLGFAAALTLCCGVVIHRCMSNLKTFRGRLRKIIKEHLLPEVHSLFRDTQEFEDAIVDEGRIEVIALLLILGAFSFAAYDIGAKFVCACAGK